jgi:hypothetical protein
LIWTHSDEFVGVTEDFLLSSVSHEDSADSGAAGC